MYSLRLFHDYLPSGADTDPIEVQHAIFYVLEGAVEINGNTVTQDSAAYTMDIAKIKALDQDSVIWRFELVPTDTPLVYATGKGVSSVMKIRRPVKMFELTPRTQWLFRLDCIYDNVGSTGLHSHPGSGIRCLLSGNLHVRGTIGEESDNVKRGDCWYEEGSYPIVSTTYGENPTAFLRGMVLPVEYTQYPDTAMWIEGEKAVKSSWKSYSQQVVRLR